MTAIVVLVAVLVAALVVGALLRARAGTVRETEAAPAVSENRRTLLTEAGVLGGAGPTVLHFSADWCGPCAAVRRVIHQVLGNLDTRLAPNLARAVEVEVDIDKNPALAKELGVLSLPTTFLFDSALTQRYRVSGVPAATDLEAALTPLCDPGTSNP
ncbi:thioredoxin family protein [Rhodococcus kronopolitis]|uniref:Thioredoxin family protein n=1 Tax=Rhodococcus kronopolitis TaxID=1460226 RepID=A0ABV9FND6_9NOCA